MAEIILESLQIDDADNLYFKTQMLASDISGTEVPDGSLVPGDVQWGSAETAAQFLEFMNDNRDIDNDGTAAAGKFVRLYNLFDCYLYLFLQNLECITPCYYQRNPLYH